MTNAGGGGGRGGGGVAGGGGDHCALFVCTVILGNGGHTKR